MQNHICPVWIGYFLASPLRKLLQSPQKILQPFIKPGDTVLDFGSAMGFFSLPMAEMVGPGGRVICVDIQEKMLTKLSDRARRAQLESRLVLEKGDVSSLEKFTAQIDFLLAFAVVHEVPDEISLLQACYQTLKPGGQLFIAEPKGHVSQERFARTVIAAKQLGLQVLENPIIHKSWTVVLRR